MYLIQRQVELNKEGGRKLDVIEAPASVSLFDALDTRCWEGIIVS
jgi:hypothetical protein